MTRNIFCTVCPPDATVTLTQAAYIGTEGDLAFGDVCVQILLSGDIEANLIVSLATATGAAQGDAG